MKSEALHRLNKRKKMLEEYLKTLKQERQARVQTGAERAQKHPETIKSH